MKIAICFYGLVGGSAGNDGRGKMLNPSIAAKTIQKNIINVNEDVDIFIHTWSVNMKDKLNKLYNPKYIVAEPQKQWSINFHENKSYSRWNSNYKTLKLKQTYEQENDFKYDCVFCSRLDAKYLTPFKFNEYDLDNIWVGYMNKRGSTKIEEHAWFPGNFNRLPDFWIFGSSELMDGFIDNYKRFDEFVRLSKHPIPDRVVSNHDLIYNYIKSFTANIKQTKYLGIDYDFVRNVRR